MEILKVNTAAAHTAGDKGGQEARGTPHDQESQLGDLAGAVDREQGDGESGHLHQAEDHLGQVYVHPEIRDVEREPVVHKHVGEPESEGNEEREKQLVYILDRLSL